MQVPNGTSDFIAKNIGMGVALVGGIHLARGTVNFGVVLVLLALVHIFAHYVSYVEGDD